MSVAKFILRLLGWLVIVILQIAASFLLIFLFSEFFSGVDATSRADWLAVLFFIWLGYVIGIYVVGYASLVLVWKQLQLVPLRRLAGTMIGALVPLLILLPIGYSIPVGDSGTRFNDLVTNNWQPILAQASLFGAILGFYLPAVFSRKSMPRETAQDPGKA